MNATILKQREPLLALMIVVLVRPGRPARAGVPVGASPGQPAHRQHPAGHAGADPDVGDRHPRHRPVGGVQPGPVGHGGGLLAAHNPGLPLGVVVLAAMLAGLALGLVNGWLIGYLELPPIVITLGTMSVYRGLVFVISAAPGSRRTRCRPPSSPSR
jgi:rhamnose transport system permease protein